MSVFWYQAYKTWLWERLLTAQGLLCVLINIWTTGEVGEPLNRFEPSSKIVFLTVPRWFFFCGSFMLFLSCFVMILCTSVCWCLVVTCWERADLLVLVCDVFLWRCHFPIGILDPMWCSIVSIPDLCPLSYFTRRFNMHSQSQLSNDASLVFYLSVYKLIHC